MSTNKRPRGAPKGNQNAVKEKTLSSVIYIECTQKLKALCVKAAHPGAVNPWARETLERAAKAKLNLK